MNKINQFFKKPYIYLIIILAGILLKFYGLDSKFFWLDEIYTIHHTSGISTGDYYDMIPKDSIVNITYYNELLDLNNGNFSIDSQLHGLSEMPQFTPLHYVFLVFWHRLVGGDYIDYRLFTVFCFLLTLPLLYLLARNVFKSKLAGLIATSFYAVSPFLHIYAQEARYYILWAFFLVLINYLLLESVNRNKLKWWIFYSIASVLALYTSTLSFLILLGHLIYIWFWHKRHRISIVLSLLFTTLIYLPWALYIMNNKEGILNSIGWQNGNISIWKTLVGPWYGVAHVFSQTEAFWGYFVSLWGDEISMEMIVAMIIHTALIILIFISIIYLIRKARAKTTWFLLLLIIPGIIFFYIMDFTGRWITFAWRYHIMNFTGIILITSLFLERKISAGKMVYSLLYLSIITLGIFSILKISQNKCRPGFDECVRKTHAAEIFSAEDKALVITDLSHSLAIMGFWETIVACTSENIDILYTTDPESLQDNLFGRDYSGIFLYHASSQMTFGVQKHYIEHDLLSRYSRTIIMDTYITAYFSDIHDVDINNYILDETAIDLETSTVTFIIIPKVIPPSSTIYIAGNHHEIGHWTANQVSMTKGDDGNWSRSCRIENGYQLEYKITRGDWESEFVDKKGNVLSNMKLDVKQDTTITVVVEGWKDME